VRTRPKWPGQSGPREMKHAHRWFPGGRIRGVGVIGAGVPQDYTEVRPEVVAVHPVDARVCLRPPLCGKYTLSHTLYGVIGVHTA
jgi:hypothetical protein